MQSTDADQYELGPNALDDAQVKIATLKQASHWHEFCFRNALQYGVPSCAILVAQSLSRRQSDA